MTLLIGNLMIIPVMDGWNGLGKGLILIGAIIAGTGLLMTVITRVQQIPLVGKLPGDLIIEKKNVTLYFPLTTSIIVSILLTLILTVFRK